MRLRRTAALLASFVTAGALVATSPGADALSELPILWEGVVRTPDGAPAPAEVTAFLRPPAEALVPNVPLVPVATATTDAAGRYTLRSLPSAAFRAVQDDAGWVTLLVAAFGADDVTVAVDSVAWKPSENRWVTHPADLDGEASESALPVSAERPIVMTLSSERSQGRGPTGAGSCWMKGSSSQGERWVHVGELHLNTDWGGRFEYTNTKSTSWQIGVSQGQGPWKVGGSVSWARGRDISQRKHQIPDEKSSRVYNWDAELRFTKFEWGCNKGYPNVHEASTLEPVGWTTSMQERTGGPVPGCNPNYRRQVVPTADFVRKDEGSVTLQGAISLLGFTGSMTSAMSESTFNLWRNPLPRHRLLCGESGDLTGDTRVQSLP